MLKEFNWTNKIRNAERIQFNEQNVQKMQFEVDWQILICCCLPCWIAFSWMRGSTKFRIQNIERIQFNEQNVQKMPFNEQNSKWTSLKLTGIIWFVVVNLAEWFSQFSLECLDQPDLGFKILKKFNSTNKTFKKCNSTNKIQNERVWSWLADFDLLFIISIMLGSIQNVEQIQLTKCSKKQLNEQNSKWTGLKLTEQILICCCLPCWMASSILSWTLGSTKFRIQNFGKIQFNEQNSKFKMNEFEVATGKFRFVVVYLAE